MDGEVSHIDPAHTPLSLPWSSATPTKRSAKTKSSSFANNSMKRVGLNFKFTTASLKIGLDSRVTKIAKYRLET